MSEKTPLSERVRKRKFHKRVQCKGGPQSHEDMLVDVLANYIADLESRLAEAERERDVALAQVAASRSAAESQNVIEDALRAEVEALRGRVRERENSVVCAHDGYSFKDHGRCCPKCGVFLTDFGD